MAEMSYNCSAWAYNLIFALMTLSKQLIDTFILNNKYSFKRYEGICSPKYLSDNNGTGCQWKKYVGLSWFYEKENVYIFSLF